MFDNLRDSSFYEEEPNEVYKEPIAKPAARRRRSGRFLGMTSQQRFFISMMLMITVCIVGFLALFILGKMSLF
jgi:hypothetical protein